MSENNDIPEFINYTEQPSAYDHLEKMSVHDLLTLINQEDHTVAEAVQTAIPFIEPLVQTIADKILSGGRLFYIGAGTSGRLGILDASEIPPTYGMPEGVVIAIIAGGEKAIQHPVENAEDDEQQGWTELNTYHVSDKDIVVGIASSGRTPYVSGALKRCREAGIITACIVCNPGSPVSFFSDFVIEVIVGAEFVTGSTRMKSGTAQKMVLNMISTSVMILIGRVEGNSMVNMQLTNAKLVERGTRMVMEQTGISDAITARQLLIKYGSVKKAIESTY
ncbi:MAG: N-acetylmuramic acid 6-phosphate etherase [Chitinophagaceae bacterium]|nr:N-acetylmuramic acid 6-phosphate etherase [Chitinophagaceae bacterium]